ncbi:MULTISPECIES: hypothetical protein [unclassified Allomuricauda]|nr:MULTISPECIES: hypothetical protein [unclassified Allomuricauda]
MFFTKIRAGALQFVLFIGTIIVLLLFGFILMNHSNALLDKRSETLVDLIQETNSGLRTSFDNPMHSGQQRNLDSNISGIHTTVSKDYWGLIEKRKVVSEKGKLRFEKLALVGHQAGERQALYIKDANRPLVVAGSAKIVGDAYLPERGIKMGNIGGHGYTGPQLVYGNSYRSQGQLPSIHQEAKQQLQQFTSTYQNFKGNRTNLRADTDVKNSFTNETLLIEDNLVELGNVSLSGNIVIRATNEIRINSTARLRDVVLIAPRIAIGDGVKGSFQAISSERIMVGNNCQLEYPTVLAVNSNPSKTTTINRTREPAISIGRRSIVAGSVVYLDKKEQGGLPLFMTIDEGAKVAGEIYCEQSLELKGSVYGSVITDSFVAFENGNTYLNHLFNGEINASLLPKEFSGLVYGDKQINSVVKWMY